jgi:conjugal transfer mating pair stabilization protein TraG
MKSLLKIIIVTGIILTASHCYALDMDYYTWNGFDIEVEAWTILTLIFSDNGYITLFFAVVTMGIFLGGAGTIFALLSGQKKGSPLSWAWPLGLGVIIYLGLIVPKGNLTIYDPVVNKFQTISHVPNGLVAVAGVLNKVEKGLSDIITTSGGYPPGEQYDNAAGAIGPSIILAFTGINTLDANLNQSLDDYVGKCVTFEMSQPSPLITLNDLDTSNDLTDVMAAAANPSVPVTYWDSSNPGGTATTCNVAWHNISSIIGQQSTYTAWEMKACASAGFNVSDAAQVQRCEDVLGDTIQYLYNNDSFQATTFIVNTVLAKKMDTAVQNLNPEMAMTALANQNAFSSGMGSTLVASQYIPVAKAIFKAIVIGMIPFLMLFLPTTLSGKTIGIIVGFFVFVACWGICDVIIHNLIMIRTFNEIQNIRDHGMSYTGVALWPTAGQRAINLYGNMRAGSIMFAAIISTVLCKFGNYALTAVAGGVSGMATATGNLAGHTAMSLGEEGKFLEGQRSGFAAMGNVRGNDFELDSMARAAYATGSGAATIDNMKAFGGPGKATRKFEDGMAGNMAEQISSGVGKTDAGLDNVIDIATGRAAGGVKGQIDRQAESEYKNQSLRDGTEAIQKRQSGAEPVIGDTGTIESYKGDVASESGWREVNTPHGTWFVMDGITAKAKFSNYSANTALNNRSEMTVSASSGLQNEVRWTHLATDNKQFSKDNRVSEEVGKSAERYTLQEYSNRISNDDSLSKSVRETVSKAINGTMSVGFQAAAPGSISPFGNLKGGMTIGKTKADGETRDVRVTAHEAEILNKAWRESQTEAIRRSLSSGNSRSWANQLSEAVGSAETKGMTKMATEGVSLNESQSQDISSRLVDYVSGKYNLSKSEAVEMIDTGYANRDKDTAYVASGVLMGKDLQNEVNNTMANTESDVTSHRKDQSAVKTFEQNIKNVTRNADNIGTVNPDKVPKSSGINEHAYKEKEERIKGEHQKTQDEMTPYPKPVLDAVDKTTETVKGWFNKKSPKK